MKIKPITRSHKVTPLPSAPDNYQYDLSQKGLEMVAYLCNAELGPTTLELFRSARKQMMARINEFDFFKTKTISYKSFCFLITQLFMKQYVSMLSDGNVVEENFTFTHVKSFLAMRKTLSVLVDSNHIKIDSWYGSILFLTDLSNESVTCYDLLRSLDHTQTDLNSYREIYRLIRHYVYKER